MRLSALLRDLPRAMNAPERDPDISGVVCDSRRVSAGALFAAVPGVKTDGHDFLGQAAERGAAACLIQRADADCRGMVPVVVPDVEEALGWASSAFHGHPSRRLTLVGITGTNGKTTTAYLVQHLLREAGVVTGRLGTVSYDYPSGEEDAPLTTPDAPTLQAALARMVGEGAGAAVAEVSSHALVRRRVAGCAFACAVFTNLTQDHLDFHGTMEEYYAAKRLLFTDHPRLAEAVVNADDPWGRQLAPDLGGHVVTYGLREGDVRFEPDAYGADGTHGTVRYPGGAISMRLPLAGAFNAQNAAAALGVAWALGLDIVAAARALGRAPQTPGRLEGVENSLGVAVYVDYAHTPDALDRVLEALRAVTEGRLLCLFGCGGDRDRTKRPRMAAAAAKWADLVVVTADNSRSEKTEAILDEIEAGFPTDWRRGDPGRAPEEARRFVRVEDREEAIRWIVDAARPGDVVILAGKGHERTQTIGGRVAPFDDREAAKRALRARGDR